MGKNPQNHENVRNKTEVYEQKPIEIDDFNEAEENKIKKRIENRKIKREEVAEKTNFFKISKNKRKTRKLKKTVE